jgi:UDP-N-acetylglucosamine 1-carboxyvinyltransferase
LSGGQYEAKSGKLVVNGKGVGCPLPFLETEVYPGFPTDLQSPLMAVLTTIPGRSRIREQIFEDRYKAASGFVRMGARITVTGRDAVIDGVEELFGCSVQAQELRGGAALVLAALAARGETLVHGCSFIRRGYEHICQDLNHLGACLTTG